MSTNHTTTGELAAWRMEHRVTQARLAELTGRAENTIARWERGEITPPPELWRVLRDIAEHDLAESED